MSDPNSVGARAARARDPYPSVRRHAGSPPEQRSQHWSAALLLAAVTALTGCSGGGNGADTNAPPPGSLFHLTGCSLGCTGTGGCATSEIAPNQPLTFEFDEAIAAASVDTASISIRTAAGEPALGVFEVDRRTVTFRPSVRLSGSTQVYGLRPNTDYALSIGAATQPPVIATSGRILGTRLACPLHVGSTAIDVDGQPPRLEQISPVPASTIDARPTIVLEFSEFVDVRPFLDGGSPPVEFWVGDPGVGAGGAVTCNRMSLLPGVPRLENDQYRAVTVLTFVPRDPLPAESCLSIQLTARIVDLAGNAAAPVSVPPMFVGRLTVQRDLVFTFDDESQMDRERSSGHWSGGSATFGAAGGDGRHGDFLVTDGQLIAPNRYAWSTDNQVISIKDTTIERPVSGQLRVTDGRFYFSRFVVPAGVVVEFRGANPAQVFVRGECRIDGQILCNGVGATDLFNSIISSSPPSQTPPGQTGGAGGPSGGAGGSGANRANGQGPQAMFDGRNGEDLRVPGGSFWASNPGLTATGGRGSKQFPAHGLNANLQWLTVIGSGYALETGKGGGGGGFVQAGGAGLITTVATVSAQTTNITDSRADSGAAGLQFDAPAVQPRPNGVSSIDYYLVGGSGGGGGGSHPAFARQLITDPNPYRAGSAGGGGGGALLVRAGFGFTLGASGVIEARGGRGPSTVTTASLFTSGASLPGGGGSGGTILIQSDDGFAQNGRIDVSGGTAGRAQMAGLFLIDVSAGAGSPGYVRLEAVGGPPASAGNVVPGPAGLGEFLPDDFDAKAGFLSKWVSTHEEHSPQFSRYEIEATVDGVHRLFTDDPSIANGLPAFPGLSALVLLVQPVDTDPSSGAPLPSSTPGPWRHYVGGFGQSVGQPGLGLEGMNGFRFLMYVDRAMAQSVVVQRLRIVYRS